jgi:hypothetical protein
MAAKKKAKGGFDLWYEVTYDLMLPVGDGFTARPGKITARSVEHAEEELADIPFGKSYVTNVKMKLRKEPKE